MLKNSDRRLLTILLIIFVQMIGASMILPILPLYAESKFSMSPRTITLLNTAFFGAQLLAGPTIGRLSDRYGRVPVLIVSQIGTVISFLMLAFAPSVGWLFAARLLDGVTGGNIIVARAYVVDIIAPEKRTQALAYISAAFGAGFIIGPAVGGLLSGVFGIQVPYIIAAGAATITVLITWRVLDESLSAEVRQQNAQQRGNRLSLAMIRQNSVLTKVLFVAFLSQFALGALQSIFSLYAAKVMLSDYSEQGTQIAIGLMLAFFGLSQVATQMALVPRLIIRLREARMALLGVVARSAGLGLLSFTASPFLALPAVFVMAFGIGTAMPALNSLAMTDVSDDMRGGVQGVYQSVLNLAIIFSSSVVGLLFEIQPNLPLLIGAGFSLVAVIPLLPLLNHPSLAKTKTTTTMG